MTSIEPAPHRSADSGRPERHAAGRRRPAAADGGLRLATLRPNPASVVITARGVVDLRTAPRLAGLVTCRLGGTIDLLVLDLSDLEFLGTTGLSALGRAQLTANARQILLRVVTGDNRAVLRALGAAGLRDRLCLRGDLAAALR